MLPYLFVPAPPGRLNSEEDLEGLAREIDAKMAEHRQAQQQRRSNEQQLAGEQPPPPQQQPHQTWRNQQQQSLVCVHGIEFTQMTRIYGYHRYAYGTLDLYIYIYVYICFTEFEDIAERNTSPCAHPTQHYRRRPASCTFRFMLTSTFSLTLYTHTHTHTHTHHRKTR